MAAKTYTDDEIAAALLASAGGFAAAAERLGCRPQTVSRRVRASRALREVCAWIEEAKLDHAEEKLMEAVDKGTLGAITFYLRSKGRRRGWGGGTEDDEAQPPATTRRRAHGTVSLPEPARDAADWTRRFKPKS